MDWGFYGRADELRAVTQIISRNRWYFAKMTGRRRIGKTTLIQKAILEDRSAPLYNRTTDEITLTHLDIASLKALLREHADLAPERLLFLWTLFEGVPKFYRDCYEQGVLNQDRQTLLRRIFFESSS